MEGAPDPINDYGKYLTIYENTIKNNKFDGTYDNQGWKKLLN